MKKTGHPDYHEITVVMTDGTTYKTRSTYGKAGDTLRLEIDSKSHPAWTGGQQRLLDSGGQLARFNKRFQGFGLKKNKPSARGRRQETPPSPSLNHTHQTSRRRASSSRRATRI